VPNLYQGDGGPVEYNNPPPPRLLANPGPPPRGSYSGSRSAGSGHPSPPPQPPPDVFAGYLGPEIDAAKQLVQQFLALAGYPHGMDANGLTLWVLQAGDVSDPMAAFQMLYNVLPMEARQRNPGAAFGLDAATFSSRQNAIDATFKSLIGRTGWEETASQDWMDQGQWALVGNRDAIQNIYRKAFAGNWSQTQILQALTGSSESQVVKLLKDQPWLAQGQGFQQASQQYASLYGAPPVDTSTLAAWFKFNTGSAQLSRTQHEAVESAAPLAGVGGGTQTR
jgi:hypothetical protein